MRTLQQKAVAARLEVLFPFVLSGRADIARRTARSCLPGYHAPVCRACCAASVDP